ncbi:uncharacterized protein LOC125495273 [Beta vulgaris subsp. vulgaris]|uniref:uncharacterized protein LOC125495273 n=1 Tax=Beta vulgaris subsp. vulgaris TaxID=3555 RepID=UPI002036D763|nr:uncharacterized protein LOC125495273 [Beta vulgaris subsp. vulgaris]
MEEQVLLFSLLGRAVLSPTGMDYLVWTPDKSDKFSVKACVLELAKARQSAQMAPIKSLWSELVPHRIEIFTWFAVLRKLNTKDKLGRLGIIPSSNTNCIFCMNHMETHEHLFLTCVFSRKLWDWWLQLWKLQWAFPSSIKEVFEQWQYPHNGIFFKKVWAASFFIILWTIWRERNARNFNEVFSSISQLKDLILLRLSWWIKGWGVPFPYNSADILRNPYCLLWRPSLAGPRGLSPILNSDSWSPPPPDSLKWNVDASLHPFRFKSAIGGVLRDHFGNFICLFSSPIPTMDINNAEILAIHRAIKFTRAVSG